MTGAEHYERADHLIEDAGEYRESDPARSRMLMAAAHTHAIQAQTAALIQAGIAAGVMSEEVTAAWELVLL